MNFLRRIFYDSGHSDAQPTTVSQHGTGNTCLVGNEITIHIDNFNSSGKFQDNPYFHDDVTPEVLKSLIPIFEAQRSERFTIRVKSIIGIVTFDVHPSDDIRSIKLKLQLMYGIPYSKQYLIFENKILEDKNKLNDYNAKDICRLDMVFTKKDNGMIFQRIHGRWFCLPIQPHISVRNVKALIEMEEGLPVDRQQLFLDNGAVLRDEMRISDYRIGKNQVITIGAKVKHEDVVTIYVKTLSGDTISIVASLVETIEDIKFKIQEKEGTLRSDQQRLIFAGKQLENEFTLAYYHISDLSVLHLVPRFRGGGYVLFIRTSIGEIITLGFIDENISNVKRKIKEIKGVSIHHQKLFFQNKELEDETKSLSFYTNSGTDLYKSGAITLDLLLW